MTHHAVMRGTPVRENPDSGQGLLERKIQALARVLEIAVAAADETGLGYLGADVVIDARSGPVILELNARPGLTIQVVNRAGLRPRLDAVDARLGGAQRDQEQRLPVAERVALGQEIALSVKRGAAQGRELGQSLWIAEPW
jgi:hypothetical protein